MSDKYTLIWHTLVQIGLHKMYATVNSSMQCCIDNFILIEFFKFIYCCNYSTSYVRQQCTRGYQFCIPLSQLAYVLLINIQQLDNTTNMSVNKWRHLLEGVKNQLQVYGFFHMSFMALQILTSGCDKNSNCFSSENLCKLMQLNFLYSQGIYPPRMQFISKVQSIHCMANCRHNIQSALQICQNRQIQYYCIYTYCAVPVLRDVAKAR